MFVGDSGWVDIDFFETKPQLPEENARQYSKKITSKISCKYYGIECNFITDEKEIKKIIKEFREHSIEEHNIDFPEGILMKCLINKNSY